MDAPEILVDFEARKIARAEGDEEVTVELYEQVRQIMSYSGMPDSLRHKRYEVEYDMAAITAITDRVEMCRKYIDQVLNTIPQTETALV